MNNSLHTGLVCLGRKSTAKEVLDRGILYHLFSLYQLQGFCSVLLIMHGKVGISLSLWIIHLVWIFLLFNMLMTPSSFCLLALISS
jgi:hypothetical protein